MSHSRERSEKICLNCNAQIHGRFCHVCGQENTDPRESLWSIITHFFNDITHFDGKFFSTTGKLLTKPGFLPKEFILGRRARYLHPIRLYVFTSALFFLAFYSFSSSAINSPGFFILDPIDSILSIAKREKPYVAVAQYDSVQRTLPVEKRDNWIGRKMMERNIERRIKYGDKDEAMSSSILSNFVHSFPYLLFVSLPVSALFLQLLYFRNKNNLYAGHTIFLVYLYVFTFVTGLIFLGLSILESAYHIGWIGYLKAALLVYLILYSLIAMKRYYAQGWGKTIFKFVVYNILVLFAIMILFLIFLLISLLKV